MKQWVAAFAGLILACSAAIAQDYSYPFQDPLMATVAGAPTDEHLKEIIIREKIFSIKVFEKKQLPPTMRNLEKYEFSLAWQGDKAPLIFVIAGTGSNYKAANMKLLQKIFHDAGFHVICLSSTFSRRFAAMGSSSSTPGISIEDAQDMYRIMKMAYAQVKDRAEATEFYLTGYSLGGLNAAFLSYVDEFEQFFNFKKVFLTNPPVDLYASTARLDYYMSKNVTGRTDAFFDDIFKKVSKYFESKGDVYLDEKFLFDINQIDPLTSKDFEGLIGASFRLSLAGVAFSVDMLTDSGHILEKGKILEPRDSSTRYFKESLNWTFEDYLNKFLMPHWKASHPKDTRKDLIYKISLKALENYLKSADKIHVAHNADDIILGGDDMAFLKETFGDRLKIWPKGGHLGNMLFHPNVVYMTDFFTN